MRPQLMAEDPMGVAGFLEEANAVQNGQGRLWRIERDGTAPSWLFGTFHAPEAIAMTDAIVWDRVRAARVAIFELSREEQAALERRMATDPTFVSDPNAPPLSSRLTPQQWDALSTAFAARGVPPQAAEQMRPWVLASVLGLPACHLNAMARGARTLDAELADAARAAGVAEVGLETYDQALAAFDTISVVDLVKAIFAVPPDLELDEDVFATLAALYAEGQIAAINSFSIYLSQRYFPDVAARDLNARFMRDLLDVRNRAWMPRLLREVEQGDAFIAVGALHLAGDAGLVALLRREGWTVQRVAM